MNDDNPIMRRPYAGPVDDDAPLDDIEQLFVETMVSALLKVIHKREAEGVGLLAPAAFEPTERGAGAPTPDRRARGAAVKKARP